jgi:hypothetical protein
VLRFSVRRPWQVRPSYVETSVQKRTTSSVAHHLLIGYQRAHIAIIKAQFTSKRLANGMSVRPPDWRVSPVCC